MDCILKDLLFEFYQQRSLSNKYFRVYNLIGKKKKKFIMSGKISYLLENLSNDVLLSPVVDVFQGYVIRYNRTFTYVGFTVKLLEQGSSAPAPVPEDKD